MYMPYNTNPHMSRVRRDAVRLVCYRGWSMRQVARHVGVEPSTISRWVKLDPTGGWKLIPTKSSRPHSHPHAISQNIINRIVEIRSERNQCAEVVHHRLSQEGVEVSLSSVKRTLRRLGIRKFSKWKKWHIYQPRPIAEKPGLLVEIDTVWDGKPKDRLYVYTLLDVCSRWSYAWASEKIDTWKSVRFLECARRAAPFEIQTLQSDHGSEFSKRFSVRMEHRGIAHRHSRIRQPNDNAHLERFNRTLQDECLRHIPRSLRSYRKEIPEYLEYYNSKRPHMGLSMKTPLEVLRSY